jgi:hypothetical protein
MNAKGPKRESPGVPTHERLKELADYDPETGVFTWRASRPRARKGAIAGTKRPDGYWAIAIDCKLCYAHRLAWLYMTGKWPTADIDHINGNKSDNRIANLRQATRSQNKANTPPPRHNTSGLKGVSLEGRRWKAQIERDGKKCHLGLFDTPEEAYAAYCKAAREHFGEFYLPPLLSIQGAGHG